MQRAAVALTLGVVFPWQVLVTGVMTAWLIVRPRGRPMPAVIRMPYQQLSPTGAVVLACLVSLTPGTTVIDIDVERHLLVLHLLEGQDSAQAVEAIRNHFERRLRVLFPEGRP